MFSLKRLFIIPAFGLPKSADPVSGKGELESYVVNTTTKNSVILIRYLQMIPRLRKGNESSGAKECAAFKRKLFSFFFDILE